MQSRPVTVALALATAALFACTSGPARAATLSSAAAQVSAAPSLAGRSHGSHGSHASIHFTIGGQSAWVGQAIPITIRAQFRDVEGVTLEGAPQLTSESVFTSDLSHEPRQSTAVVDGEPTLVATWSGTITPSTAGPLAISVELPVRIRFHDPVPDARILQNPMQGDPFGGMDIDPSDPSSIQRFFQSFQQSFAQPFEAALGRAHDDALTLKADASRLEVKALPAAGQPATFSGAVGRFDIHASVADGAAHSSVPLTLRVTVQGDGDLDRVDPAGVATSADWKAYPMTSKTEAPAPGTRLARKTFEQTLIPLHGGELTIPSIAFSAFEPSAGRYVTFATSPLTVAVEGPLVPSPAVEPAAPVAGAARSALADTPAADRSAVPSPASLVPAPRAVGFALAPLLAALLAAFAVRWWPPRDGEKSLRRTLRRAARAGNVPAFFDAARHLIALHFAKRWGIAETEVTADALRGRLGPEADPLLAAISNADALRFGRRDVGPVDLTVACSSIEGTLRSAS